MHFYDDIPIDRLIEIFGHGNPKQRELQAYSDLLWRDSIKYRRNIKRTIIRSRVYTFMREIGCYQLLDFQIRDQQIRFTNEGILSIAVIAGIDELLEGPIDSNMPFSWT